MMTDITKWLEDFEQRLERNTRRINFAKKTLADLAAQLPDPVSDRSEILRRMENWIGIFKNSSIERNDLKDELEEKQHEALAAVARASGSFFDDSEQPNA